MQTNNGDRPAHAVAIETPSRRGPAGAKPHRECAAPARGTPAAQQRSVRSPELSRPRPPLPGVGDTEGEVVGRCAHGESRCMRRTSAGWRERAGPEDGLGSLWRIMGQSHREVCLAGRPRCQSLKVHAVFNLASAVADLALLGSRETVIVAVVTLHPLLLSQGSILPRSPAVALRCPRPELLHSPCPVPRRERGPAWAQASPRVPLQLGLLQAAAPREQSGSREGKLEVK